MYNKKRRRKGMIITLVVAAIWLVGVQVNANTPDCIMADCDRTPCSNSSYCAMHDMNNRLYGNPNHSRH